jgi:transcriptional regulator with XRE-family HTH domain
MKSIKSQRDLAKALGKSQAAVGKWLNDRRWPFSKSGPWSADDVKKIREWAKRTLASDPAAKVVAAAAAVPLRITDLDPERQLDMALKMEKVETSKLRRDMMVDGYHRVDDCNRHRARQVREVRAQLLELDQLILSRS